MTPYEEMHRHTDTNRRSVFTLYEKGSLNNLKHTLVAFKEKYRYDTVK